MRELARSLWWITVLGTALVLIYMLRHPWLAPSTTTATTPWDTAQRAADEFVGVDAPELFHFKMLMVVVPGATAAGNATAFTTATAVAGNSDDDDNNTTMMMVTGHVELVMAVLSPAEIQPQQQQQQQSLSPRQQQWQAVWRMNSNNNTRVDHDDNDHRQQQEQSRRVVVPLRTDAELQAFFGMPSGSISLTHLTALRLAIDGVASGSWPEVQRRVAKTQSHSVTLWFAVWLLAMLTGTLCTWERMGDNKKDTAAFDVVAILLLLVTVGVALWGTWYAVTPHVLGTGDSATSWQRWLSSGGFVAAAVGLIGFGLWLGLRVAPDSTRKLVEAVLMGNCASVWLVAVVYAGLTLHAASAHMRDSFDAFKPQYEHLLRTVLWSVMQRITAYSGTSASAAAASAVTTHALQAKKASLELKAATLQTAFGVFSAEAHISVYLTALVLCLLIVFPIGHFCYYYCYYCCPPAPPLLPSLSKSPPAAVPRQQHSATSPPPATMMRLRV